MRDRVLRPADMTALNEWKTGQRPRKIHLWLLPFGSDQIRQDSARADLPINLLGGFNNNFKYCLVLLLHEWRILATPSQAVYSLLSCFSYRATEHHKKK